MSTRCVVRVIYDNKICLKAYYHHCDGYPSYMIKDLYDIIARTKENAAKRGSSSFTHNDMIEAFNYKGGYDEEEFLCNHNDIEYFWIVKININYTDAEVYYSDNHLAVSDYLANKNEYKPEADEWLVKCELDEEGKPVENVKLDLPEDLYMLLVAEAESKGISVDKHINNILKDSLDSGKFDIIVKEYQKSHNL